MDIVEILKILPHRPPFLLVDRILELDMEAKRIVGLKNVSMNEPFFVGHFPGDPIMPGVLILEAMAQVAGVMACLATPEYKKGDPVYFLGLDKVRFRRVVRPGDSLVITVESLRAGSRVWKFAGQAHVGEELVAEAELLASFMVANG